MRVDLKFAYTSATVGGSTIIYFDASSDEGLLSVRLTDQGRVISVGLGARTLHDRKKNKRGRRCRCLQTEALRAIRGAACAVVAAKAIGADPKQGSWSFDL